MSGLTFGPLFARILRTSPEEWRWRIAGAVRRGRDRARIAVTGAAWNRRALASRLAKTEVPAAWPALLAGDWLDAHRALGRHFTETTPRFVIAPRLRKPLAGAILRADPAARDDAAARGAALLAGRRTLLGYTDVECDGWNHDPIHDRRAPSIFWSSVPYLDARCGDHKIIWELNRHQHWMGLGRAFWLTGNAAFRERMIIELSSWLDANAPLIGINWSSALELGFRTLSWLWALQFFADGADQDERPWIVDLLLGMDRQLGHIERNLSYYFSPNTHLTGEALALYVTGSALPELAASPRRVALGRRILVAESSRQIARDGGHCERSTHYHRYTLDFYLLALAVARIGGDPIAPVFEAAVVRLARAARALADDQGRLPHLGDDDGGMLLPLAGRAPDDIRDSLATASALTGSGDSPAEWPEETRWLLAHPTIRVPRADGRRPTSARTASPSTALPDTGYFVSRSRSGDHLVVDGGPHGHLNGGHAHADALSLTFSFAGVPLFIDPGTGCYTVDPDVRDRMRSTASHNTVEVDGHPQSMARGPFHWARVARTQVHRWRSADGFDYFDGSHDGYAPVEHRRRVLAMHGELLVVADLIHGGIVHKAAAFWHLHPRWTAEQRGSMVALVDGERRSTLFAPRGRVECFTGDTTTHLGWHSPIYGRVEPTTTVRITMESATPFWLISVIDLRAQDPVERVDMLPVWAEADTLAHGIGLRVDRLHSSDILLLAEPRTRSRPGRPLWRVGEFSTDAHLAMVRLAPDGRITRAALVDGSSLRAGGRRTLALTLPRMADAVQIDEPLIRSAESCVASPAS
jgi:Heparinase II/III-like protein/Heparinase II/III N-terminus